MFLAVSAETAMTSGVQCADAARSRRSALRYSATARGSGQARLVAEGRPAAAPRRGIDGEHRDAVAGADDVAAERLDEARLADPRHARDAEPHGVAARRQQRPEQRLGPTPVVGARG